jgi:hypothetical protein
MVAHYLRRVLYICFILNLSVVVNSAIVSGIYKALEPVLMSTCK